MSKRVLQHPEVPANEAATNTWRSIREHEETKQFRHEAIREFYDGEDQMSEEEREVSRRHFIKLMGASSALAGLGLAACRRPESYILPYSQAPEWVVPGKPLYYATNMPSASGSVPLVVTTYEGRPTKLEPNKMHPDNSGTSAQVQASVLNLYSPSRSTQVLKEGDVSTLEEFNTFLQTFRKDAKKLGIVLGSDESPTMSRMMKLMAQKFGARVYSYEALDNTPADEQLAKVYGASKVKLIPQYDQAERILSLDSDFLEGDATGSTLAFSKKRQGGGENYDHDPDKKKMNRLYQVEASYSLTGGMADHRLRISSSQVSKVAVAIANELLKLKPNQPLQQALSGMTATFKGDESYITEWVKEAAKDFVTHKSLVLVGRQQPAELHVLAAAMNEALGAVGTTLSVYRSKSEPKRSLAQLKKDVESGAIDSLILATPSNPVFDAPTDLDFPALLEKVSVSIHLGERTDATAFAASWHVPKAHYLESWGDSLSANGYYSVVQPLILPLYDDSFSTTDFFASILNDKDLTVSSVTEPSIGYTAVRKTFSSKFAGKAGNWNQLLKDGFVKVAVYEQVKNGNFGSVSSLATTYKTKPSVKSLDVVLAKDASVYDGRYIDNAWLQESPDPVIKLTWDNAALVSPKTAKELGVYDKIVELEKWNAGRPEIGEAGRAKAPMAKISVGGADVEMPVMIGFGQADYTVTLPVGYGQAATDGRVSAVPLDEEKPVCGYVGRNTGFNVYPLRKKLGQSILSGAQVVATDETYKVASTQEHHAMYGRALAREISTMDVAGKGDFKKQLKKVSYQGMDSHIPPNISLYKSKDREGEDLLSDTKHQWAMTIDLNTCTGCNACLVACQAENNIPVVGKDQVAVGREMHWIRMDRYYASQDHEYDDHGHAVKGSHTPDWVKDNPAMLPQPVACTQCESAPCETVCPVNATVHTEEGLNSMAYNRCIGTRYCANNCPFKARRFNFFDYNKRNPLMDKNLYKGPLGEKKVGDAPHLQRNPNVTVRMRGVMEKCTYCVQRLELGKIKQKQITKQKTEFLGSSLDVTLTDEDLRVGTDAIKVACQQACPSDSVSFGNLLNKEDKVNRAKSNSRNYELLKYIGTFSRTTYLARVKNPNPTMPDAKYVGRSTINIH